MTRIRRAMLLFAIVAALPVVTDALIQQQRAQIQVSITINVTPNPLGYAEPPAATDTSVNGIVARMVLNTKESPSRYRAENLAFDKGRWVAQSQGGIKVEATVTPNPNGTLLVSNLPGVQENQEAGTTVAYPCAYTVTVTTTQTAWTLEHGLFSDFSGFGGSFTGHDAANKTHLTTGTPQPAYTPFIVYSGGQSWVIAASSGLTKSYCVDLQITLPISLAGGAYSTNAVYTLFY